MPTDPFAHLHVASGYSLRYGASHPEALVARAAEHGQDVLALTDRDGLYGAVKFAKACLTAGVRPVYGVDLAIAPTGALPQPQPQSRARRTPVRGGSSVDPRYARVLVLARGKPGWAALNRLVSATHLGGERGQPVTTLEQVAAHAAGGHLTVLLGPSGELGRVLAARRPDLAHAVLSAWCAVVDPAQLAVEVVCHHGGADGDPAALSGVLAARMLGFAHEHRLPAVLTNAVRYADRDQAVTADVLDAARRLVALDLRHVDRPNAEGHLKSGEQMARVAGEVARLAGLGDEPYGGAPAARHDPRARRAVRARPVRRPGSGRGVPARARGGPADRHGCGGAGGAVDAVAGHALLRRRCEGALGTRLRVGAGTRRPGPAGRRARRHRAARLRRPTSSPSPRSSTSSATWACGCAARGSGAGSLVNYLLGVCGVDPLAHGLLMERFLSPLRRALPDIDVDVESARRTEVYERILARFGGERVRVRLDDGHLPGAARDPRRRRRARPAAGRDRRDGQGVPAHPRARRARLRCADLPELRASRIGSAAAGPAVRARRAARRPAPARRAAPVRRAAVRPHPAGPHAGRGELAGLPDEPVRQGRRRGPRPAQARRPRHPHAVGDGARGRRRCAASTTSRSTSTPIPLDDPATFALIRSTHTLGCFQIESPGQRELVGKFGPETFDDLIIDISLFRPGPVKSRHGDPVPAGPAGLAASPQYLHPDLGPALRRDVRRRGLPRAGAADRRTS